MSDILPGLYRGAVSEANDPDGRGCVKVIVPLLSADAQWAMPCVPYDSGRTAIDVPPVGTQVWIAFERGDPALPVWMGVAPRP
jgi:hypothetical protein